MAHYPLREHFSRLKVRVLNDQLSALFSSVPETQPHFVLELDLVYRLMKVNETASLSSAEENSARNLSTNLGKVSTCIIVLLKSWFT